MVTMTPLRDAAPPISSGGGLGGNPPTQSPPLSTVSLSTVDPSKGRGPCHPTGDVAQPRSHSDSPRLSSLHGSSQLSTGDLHRQPSKLINCCHREKTGGEGRKLHWASPPIPTPEKIPEKSPKKIPEKMCKKINQEGKKKFREKQRACLPAQ